MFENGYISSEHLIQYQAAQLFCKNLYVYVLILLHLICTRWRCGVVVITTAQLHSTKSDLRLCAGSNLARGVSEIRDGEDL